MELRDIIYIILLLLKSIDSYFRWKKEIKKLFSRLARRFSKLVFRSRFSFH